MIFMEYTKEYIDRLIKRFMDAETTEEEEQVLADYFAETEDISAEWEPYREMFVSFNTEAYGMSDKFVEDMLEEDNDKDMGMSKPEDVAKAIPLKPKIAWWKYAGVACAVAIICSITFMLPDSYTQQQSSTENDDSLTVTDEEIEQFLADVAGNTYKAQGMDNLLGEVKHNSGHQSCNQND